MAVSVGSYGYEMRMLKLKWGSWDMSRDADIRWNIKTNIYEND